MTILYFRTFNSDKILMDVERFRQGVDRDNIQFVKEMNAIAVSEKAIIHYIEMNFAEKDIFFTLYNQSFEEIFSQEMQHTTATYHSVSNMYPIKMKYSDDIYFIKISHPLPIQQWISQSLYKNSSNYIYIILVMITLFSLLFLFFHYSITIPINRLNERLNVLKIGQKLPSLTTKRKDEIGELFKNVEEMEKRMQESNAEQVDMVGAIAHDLKTPLTSILGFLELMEIQKDLSEQKRQHYLSIIFKKTKHMQNLVDEFFDYFSNEIKLNSLHAHTIDLHSFLNSVVEEYEEEFNGLGYHFESHLQLLPSHAVKFHEEMFRRVFSNIFSNAVRYGGKEKLEISLTAYVQQQTVIIMVEDNGIGVPDEHLVNLCKKFYTVDSSRQSEKGGTGLGLASCKSIIESFGGTITAFSSPKGGLGIKIELPIAKPLA